MDKVIAYLRKKYPYDAKVFPSCEKDYVCVRHLIGKSEFGKNAAGQKVFVNSTSTDKLHVDTVRLEMYRKSGRLKLFIDMITNLTRHI
jgi:hypothetical protein